MTPAQNARDRRDSSVWIDFFNGARSEAADHLDQALGVEQVAVGDLILVEVLQGFRRDADFRTARRALTALPVLDMLGAAATVMLQDPVGGSYKTG